MISEDRVKEIIKQEMNGNFATILRDFYAVPVQQYIHEGLVALHQHIEQYIQTLIEDSLEAVPAVKLKWRS